MSDVFFQLNEFVDLEKNESDDQRFKIKLVGENFEQYVTETHTMCVFNKSNFLFEMVEARNLNPEIHFLVLFKND